MIEPSVHSRLVYFWGARKIPLFSLQLSTPDSILDFLQCFRHIRLTLGVMGIDLPPKCLGARGTGQDRRQALD